MRSLISVLSANAVPTINPAVITPAAKRFVIFCMLLMSRDSSSPVT